MLKVAPDDAVRLRLIRHASSTIDELYAQTEALYLSITAEAARAEIAVTPRKTLKDVSLRRQVDLPPPPQCPKCVPTARWLEQVSLTNELLNSIIGALDAHAAMSTQALNSPTVQSGLKDILLNHIGLWEALRGSRRPSGL